MKLRHIFATLIACLAFFASCSEDQTLDALDSIQVSKSLISLPTAGGSETVNVTAKGDWKICTKDKSGNLVDELPTWLTISQTSGEAGSTDITITAGETSKNNSSVLYLTCNGQTQWLTVIQQVGKVELPISTVANALAGADGDTYRLKGTVTKITNTLYGNWYLSDGTGDILIYGTLDANGGTKNFESLGIEVGDIVTVQGPRKTHNSDIELADVEVIEIQKSLVKVESIKGLTDGKLPKDGGEFTATLTCKGEGVSITIPDDAKSWLSVTSVKQTGENAWDVTFRAAANEKGNRSTTLTFVTTKDGKEYTATTEITQEGSIVDSSIADFLSQEVGTAQFRIQGCITKIDDAATGKFTIKDHSGEVYIYKATDLPADAQEGDIVTVTGCRGAYKGTAQMTSPKVEVYKKVITADVATFLTTAVSKDQYYKLTGTVVKPTGTGEKWDLADYGNLALQDETGKVYVFGVLTGWNGAKKQFGTLGIQEGDKITIIGYHDNYKGADQVGGAFFFAKH